MKNRKEEIKKYLKEYYEENSVGFAFTKKELLEDLPFEACDPKRKYYEGVNMMVCLRDKHDFHPVCIKCRKIIQEDFFNNMHPKCWEKDQKEWRERISK